MFQSTSVIADGRIQCKALVKSSESRFNPRPSLLTDELHLVMAEAQRRKRFQSTSVIADGRILTTTDCFRSRPPFQSTSVIADGRIVGPQAADESEGPVSIHVRHC